MIGKKNGDSIKDGLIITVTTTGIFYALETANVKLPKASKDAMDIMKVSNEIVGGVLVKDYAVYKNSTYYAKEWVQKDDKVWLIDPKDNLYQWIKKWSELLQFLEVL